MDTSAQPVTTLEGRDCDWCGGTATVSIIIPDERGDDSVTVCAACSDGYVIFPLEG